jgi:hypothetical protein
MSTPQPPPIDKAALNDVANSFKIEAEFVDGAPHGHGLINDTLLIDCSKNGKPIQFILQRINHHVFRDVPALMENIQRVTDHIAQKPRAPRRQPINLVQTNSGSPYHLDSHDYHWRCYDFITDSQSYDVIQSPAMARAAACAFGEFQAQLADLTGPRLHETIPDFHNTRQRFANLTAAIEANNVSRVATVGPEIEFALARKPLTDSLLSLHEAGEIPERITHNDTKISNVMIDDTTGEGISVIDLDTIMPGLALYDIGDLIRSATNPCLEDETNLSLVKVQLPVFEQLVDGYLSTARQILNPTEIDHLVVSGRLITFEIGLRFLTDYLSGDTYFRTTRPEQNLDRARGQFALLKSMEDAETKMQQIVAKYI